MHVVTLRKLGTNESEAASARLAVYHKNTNSREIRFGFKEFMPLM